MLDTMKNQSVIVVENYQKNIRTQDFNLNIHFTDLIYKHFFKNYHSFEKNLLYRNIENG